MVSCSSRSVDAASEATSSCQCQTQGQTLQVLHLELARESSFFGEIEHQESHGARRGLQWQREDRHALGASPVDGLGEGVTATAELEAPLAGLE